MVALMVVVVDEGLNPGFEITWQEVVFQENAVLQCLVPPLDLALSLGMIWSAAGMLHALVLQPFSQFTRDVAGSVVAEQTRLVNNVDLVWTFKHGSGAKVAADIMISSNWHFHGFRAERS